MRSPVTGRSPLANAKEFPEVPAQYFTNKLALLPAALVQVVRLANPNLLLVVEVIGVLPPKGRGPLELDQDRTAEPMR